MIKAVVTGADGIPHIIVGLSDLNLSFLKAGRPARVDLRELFMPGTDLSGADIIITWGKDEEAILDELRAGGLTVPDPGDIATTPGEAFRWKSHQGDPG